MNEWLTVTTSSPGPTPRPAAPGAARSCSSRPRRHAARRQPRRTRARTPPPPGPASPSRTGSRGARPRRRARRATGRATGISAGVLVTPRSRGRHPVVDDLLLQQLLRRLVLIAIPLEAAAADPRTARPAAGSRAAARARDMSAYEPRDIAGPGRSCSTIGVGTARHDATRRASSLMVTSLRCRG